VQRRGDDCASKILQHGLPFSLDEEQPTTTTKPYFVLSRFYLLVIMRLRVGFGNWPFSYSSIN